MKKSHQSAEKRRNTRSRGNNVGTAEKPRVCVYRSNKNIYAQAINDLEGKVVAVESSIMSEFKGSKGNVATEVGEKLGEKLAGLKVERIVFDRNGYRYHGRVKNVAEGIRSKKISF